MVSDAPDTINPLDFLNSSDWAQKAGLEFVRVTTARNGQTRLWTLYFADDKSIRLSTAELNSPAKVMLKLQDTLLKPVLLPKSANMWVAYWLPSIFEAAEQTERETGVDGYVAELLSNSAYFMDFRNTEEAAAFFAWQQYRDRTLSDSNIIFGATSPKKALLRVPVLTEVYLAEHGTRPDAHDIHGALRNQGYSEGYPVRCTYNKNEGQHRTSIRLWYKARREE